MSPARKIHFLPLEAGRGPPRPGEQEAHLRPEVLPKGEGVHHLPPPVFWWWSHSFFNIIMRIDGREGQNAIWPL